eukprot:scaffold309965_cov65-Attheya_sp.AAC.1
MPSNAPFCMQKWHRHEVRPRKSLGLIPDGWVHGSPSIFTQEVYCQNLSAKVTQEYYDTEFRSFGTLGLVFLSHLTIATSSNIKVTMCMNMCK